MSNTGSCFKKASPLTLHPHPLLSPHRWQRGAQWKKLRWECVDRSTDTPVFIPADNRHDITSPQSDTLINLVSPELFWKREPFTPASYLVSAIIGFCILPCSIYDGRITFWALTSWQGFILLPLLMTSSLQVNCRCNDFLFCFWILLKCHHDPRHLNLA